MIVVSGTKLECIKDMGGIILPKDVVEVEEVTGRGMIKFFIPSGYGYGMMTGDECMEYFKEYVAPVKPKWTEWKKTNNGISFVDVSGHHRYYDFYYKTNGIKTKGKMIDSDGFTVAKVRVSKYPTDEYNKDVALKLASMRLMQKFNKKIIEQYIEELGR